MRRLLPWILTWWALAALPTGAGAQRDSAGTRLFLRANVGFLNEDDPLDFELAGGGDLGVDFRNRGALLVRLVAQGRVADPGRSGPVPEHRVVAAIAGEYAPAGHGTYGEQFRVRLSTGVMFRQGVASAPVVAPGMLFRYALRSGTIALAFALEDLVAFLPTEYRQDCLQFIPCRAVPIDAKVEHNFGASVGLEIRL